MKILLKELGRRDVDWIDLVQDRESWQGFGCGNGTSGFKNAGNFWDS
jgi:hypothetical protein